MNIVNIDKAWDKIYDRIEKEDLLIPEKREKQIHLTFKRIAAAVLVLCVAGSVAYLTFHARKEALLSKTNEDYNKTLVTTLQDGSIVYLSQQSSLYYPENFASDERKVKMKGSALFDISKEQNRPFLVETELVSIKVLGTEFGVNAAENKTAFELFVERGKVEVTNKRNGESVLVEAGEIVSIKSGHLEKRNNYDPEKYITFTKRMSFKDERLDQILRVIQNTTGSKIILSDKDIANHLLTVTFDNNSVESMVELICLALNLNHIQKPDGIYISKL